MKKRNAKNRRKTKETQIELALSLDGPSKVSVATGLPFLDHLMEAFACHGRMGLRLKATGDLKVDPHHLIEDCGIVLGQTITMALDGSGGIWRAGSCAFPMDGSLAQVAMDICGRPNLYWNAELENTPIGSFRPKLAREFFKGLSDGMRATIHIDLIRRDNDHHALEAIAKATGRALREAVALTGRSSVQSTKGVIDD